MTQFPVGPQVDPTPFEPTAEPPPAPRRGRTLVVSWLVVIASVVWIALGGLLGSGDEEYDPTEDGWSGSMRVSVSVMSRFLVGMKRITIATPAGRNVDYADHLRSLDDVSNAAATRMRIAILAGELQGAEEAIDRIEVLEFGWGDVEANQRAADALIKVRPAGAVVRDGRPLAAAGRGA
jgi:hypothetical protein